MRNRSVVDEKAALVATFNLMEKYFTLTRNYGVITDAVILERLAAVADRGVKVHVLCGGSTASANGTFSTPSLRYAH